MCPALAPAPALLKWLQSVRHLLGHMCLAHRCIRAAAQRSDHDISLLINLGCSSPVWAPHKVLPTCRRALGAAWLARTSCWTRARASGALARCRRCWPSCARWWRCACRACRDVDNEAHCGGRGICKGGGGGGGGAVPVDVVCVICCLLVVCTPSRTGFCHWRLAVGGYGICAAPIIQLFRLFRRFHNACAELATPLVVRTQLGAKPRLAPSAD